MVCVKPALNGLRVYNFRKLDAEFKFLLMLSGRSSIGLLV